MSPRILSRYEMGRLFGEEPSLRLDSRHVREISPFWRDQSHLSGEIVSPFRGRCAPVLVADESQIGASAADPCDGWYGAVATGGV